MLTLWHDTRAFKIRLIFAIVFIFLGSVVTLALPWYLKFIVDKFSDDTIAVRSFGFILLFYGLIWILAQMLVAIRQIAVYRVFERGVYKLSMEVFEKLLTLPLAYHINRSTGGLVNSIERAQAALPKILFGLMFVVVPMIVELAIALCFLAYYYDIKFVFVLLSLSVLYAGFTWLSLGWVVTAQRIGNKAHKKSSSFIADILMNIEYIYYQDYHQPALLECHKNMMAREDAVTKQLIRLDLVYMGQIIIAGLGFIALIILVGTDVVKGKLHISDFVLFNGYLIQFLAPLNAIGLSVLRSIREGLTSMEDVMNIMLIPEELHNKGGVLLPEQPVSVEFRDVSFKYPENDRYAIQDISFLLPPGKTIALVGANGSGKSTISKLLYRLYEPSTGTIYLNNKNIQDFNLSSLREHIGVIPQDILLLNDTLYANLVLNHELDVDSDFFKNIVTKTKVSDLLSKLSDGYNTAIGERGVKLSGGEKQRIALARALLKRPKILIMDEATSALDSHTEREILESLNAEFSNISKIIITHNVNNLNFVDKIINLNRL